MARGTKHMRERRSASIEPLRPPMSRARKAMRLAAAFAHGMRDFPLPVGHVQLHSPPAGTCPQVVGTSLRQVQGDDLLTHR